MELSNTRGNCISVQNSTEKIFQESDSKDRHADVIKDFFKKKIAAQSYNKMFSKGTNFKELSIELAESSTRKASLYSLQHLSNISKNYLTKIKEKTSNLTPQEKVLLSKVVDAKLHFRHQSNSNLVNRAGTLNIMSLDKLQFDDVFTAKNTYSEDIICLSNQDFVFFGVEFSDCIDHLPLNTRHSTMDFGANAYIVDDKFPYGYLTLTDHFYNTIPPAFMHEHKNFIAQFSEVRNEIERKVHGDKGTKDVPIFNTKDMRLGLGLHLINFLRNTSDKGFKTFAMNKNLDSKDLDKILNFVFQPEFHVPRMVSTNNFKEVKLREIRVKDAVVASNFEALSAYIKNKNVACEIMGLAIEHAKKDVADFLFSKFNFTIKDVIKMSTSYVDMEYLLSSDSADEKILKEFLDRGLVIPNKPFRKVKPGDTMLDNAIQNNKKDMIDILLEYGAICGKKLITN